MRGTCPVCDWPDGVEAEAATGIHNDLSKALKTGICLTAVTGMVVVPSIITLPDFHLRIGNRQTGEVADNTLKPDALTLLIDQVAVAQQIMVRIARQYPRVKRPLGLTRGGPPYRADLGAGAQTQ